MQNPTPLVGDPIEARCSKCRKNTAHLILTLAEVGPATVQCQICSHQHNYRPPATAKKTALRQAIQHKDAESKEWERLRPGMNSSKATDYSMTASYKVKALIKHPVFGLGLVQRVVGSQKVEILFADGMKMMRCK
jgi:hypothetical protein